MLGLDVRKIISTVSAAIMLMSSSLPYMPVYAENSAETSRNVQTSDN